MSGHKRATITAKAEEIKQLSQSEMAIRFVEAGLSELSKRLDRYADQERKAESIQAAAAQDVLIQTLAQVDEAFADLEHQTQTALVEQEEQFFEQLNSIYDYSAQMNAERTEQLSQEYLISLEELAQQHDLSIQAIATKFDIFSQGNIRKKLHVKKWIEAVSILYYSIENDPFIEIISPGFLANCVELISQTKFNFKSGYSDAALIIAQNTYRDISSIKIKAQHERQQYQNLCHLLQKKLELLEQEIKLNQIVHVFDLRGNVLPDEITVDEWVGGDVSRLLEKLHLAQTLVNKPITADQVKNLKRAVYKIIPKWQQRLSDYVYQARSEAVNSQLRMNIALMVVRSLSSQGYTLVHSMYNDDDMRAGYQVQLIDNEGSQVMVQVEPTSSKFQAAELHLFTQDVNKRTPHELKQRSLEIQRSILKAGLEISELKPVVDPQNTLIPFPKKIKNDQQQIHEHFISER